MLRTVLMFLCLVLGGLCFIVTCLFFRDQSLFMGPFATLAAGFFFLAGRFSE